MNCWARRDIKLYASILMPDSEQDVAIRVVELGRQGFKAIKLGWGSLGRDEKLDVRHYA